MNKEVLHCFSAQADVKYHTGEALCDLTGWEWGSHGDMMYFTMEAYHDEKGQLKTFKYVLLFPFDDMLMISA